MDDLPKDPKIAGLPNSLGVFHWENIVGRKTRKLLFLGLIGGLLLASAAPVFALTLNEAQKLLASDGLAGDEAGVSVAIDGDTALIGARSDNLFNVGSAYVFTRSAGVWTEQQKLTASDGELLDRFGQWVALDGDTAVIGADENFASGAAYVFTRSAGVWTEQQKLTASDGAAVDRFGASVGVDGDTVVIGASSDDDNGTNSGSAYIFTRSAGVWTEQQKLTASDGAAYDYFGSRGAAIDGDTVVIPADQAGSAYVGSAYVFTRSAGVWAEQQKLTASDGAALDLFGTSVALDWDTVVIGAVWDDDNGTNSGSAYIFTRSAGVWTEQQKLTASDGAAGDHFGQSAAVEEDTVVIGAHRAYDNGNRTGSAYVFTRSAGVWTEQLKLTASDGAASDNFGISAAMDEDTVVIGAYGDRDNGFRSGSAYVFELPDVETVQIDIKPGKTPNSINPTSGQKIPVAVLATEDFDATLIDSLSVMFGPRGAAELHGKGHLKDVDEDGLTDVLFHFNTQETGIACGDTEATLTGETFDGIAIIGTDSVSTVPCK